MELEQILEKSKEQQAGYQEELDTFAVDFVKWRSAQPRDSQTGLGDWEANLRQIASQITFEEEYRKRLLEDFGAEEAA